MLVVYISSGLVGHYGRRGGLKLVSVLDSGLSGPGSSPDQGTVLCSWARHFTLSVSLHPVHMGTPGGHPAMD